MTFAEIIRVLESNKRKKQERAVFDYTLANLIGRNVARTQNSSITIPTLVEVYPMLFDSEEEKEKIQEQKNNISAIRFKMFTQSYNTQFKEGENKEWKNK